MEDDNVDLTRNHSSPTPWGIICLCVGVLATATIGGYKIGSLDSQVGTMRERLSDFTKETREAIRSMDELSTKVATLAATMQVYVDQQKTDNKSK